MRDETAASDPYAAASELAAYRDEPKQMPAGAPGKNGYLRMRFARRGKRTVLSDLACRTPLLAQQALYYDDAMPSLASVMMICTSGGTLQGDRHAIEIVAERDAEARVTTQSATKIQEMDANFAAQTLDIVLGENAYVEYAPDAVIPYRDARYVSRTRIALPPSATLLYCETLTSGRRHYRAERFEFALFSSAITASRPDGPTLCGEKLILEPRGRDPRTASVMAGFDVFANVLLLTPPAHAARVFEQTSPLMDARRAAGATRLPNGAGVAYKVVGEDRETVEDVVNAFCARVRRVVKNAETAPHFRWR